MECYWGSMVVFTSIVAFNRHNKPEGNTTTLLFLDEKTWVLRWVKKCVQGYTTQVWNRD